MTAQKQRRNVMNAIITGEFRPLPGSAETEHDKAVRRVADAVHRVNEAIIRAVEAGVSVEISAPPATMTGAAIGATR